MNRMKEYGLDSCGLEYGPVAVSCTSSDKLSGSIKCRKFLENAVNDSFVTK